MKKILLTLLFNIILFVSVIAQNICSYDYIIDMNYYKAYYSTEIQTSSFVIYKLYKGGGDVSRKGLNFKKYNGFNAFQYTNSGYDRGHLVPAEDMAYSEESLKSTFYYINAIPQNPTLNRSIWKQYEDDIRDISQQDSLIIVCGGCDYNGLIPQRCFKLVYNLKTKKCIYSIIFINDASRMIIYNDPKLKQKFTFSKTIQLYNKK